MYMMDDHVHHILHDGDHPGIFSYCLGDEVSRLQLSSSLYSFSRCSFVVCPSTQALRLLVLVLVDNWTPSPTIESGAQYLCAPSIPNYGSLVRADAQIVALRALC